MPFISDGRTVFLSGHAAIPVTAMPADTNVYGDIFGDHRPVLSMVVAELAIPGALVEIEVVAWDKDG